MTSGDWLIIAVCTALGYVVVSWLIDGVRGGGRPRTPPEGDAPARPPAPAPDPAERRWADVLEVSPAAGADVIRAAYRQLMSQYHPDKVASLGPELRELAERKSKEISTAYAAAKRERGFD